MELNLNYFILFFFLCKRIRSTSEEFPFLLDKFPGYSIIFHVNNESVKNFNNLIETRNLRRTPSIILNYDKSMRNTLRKPEGYKFLNVVILKKIREFEKFSCKTHNVLHKDVIVFLGSNTKTIRNYRRETCSMGGFHKAGSVFFYQLKQKKLYHVKYFSGSVENRVEPLKSLKINLSSYLNDFRNFNGYNFKVAFTRTKPNVWCRYVENKCFLKGVEADILNFLSKHLNFTYTLENYEGRIGGSWTSMINSINYEKIDWAIGGISATYERVHLVDFTTILKEEPYGVVFSMPKTNTRWDALILPFGYKIWSFLLILWFFYLVLTIKINSIFWEESHYDITIYLIRCTLEQPNLRIPKPSTLKVLLLNWYFSFIIILAIYKSQLASSFIKSEVSKINTIRDLIDDDYSFAVNSDEWTVLRTYLQSSTDTLFEAILDKANNRMSFCKAVKSGLHKKIAVVEEVTVLQYKLWDECGEFFKGFDKNTFRLTRDYLFSTIFAWPLQKGVPYATRFSRVISDLHATGHVQKWYQEAMKGKYLKKENISNQIARPLQLTSLLAAFYILFFGYVTSLIVALIEITYFKYNYISHNVFRINPNKTKNYVQ